MLVQVLSPDEVEPVYNGRLNLVDSETEDLSDGRNMKLKITRNMQAAYDEALSELKENIRSFCASRGADFYFRKQRRAHRKGAFRGIV